jgi:hypothetical protein
MALDHDNLVFEIVGSPRRSHGMPRIIDDQSVPGIGET